MSIQELGDCGETLSPWLHVDWTALPPLFVVPHPLLPAGEGSLYLYVVEILDVGVKVGVTRRPAHRLESHVTQAWAYRRQVGRGWLSRSAAARFVLENEAALVGGSPTEYLEAGFDETVARAEALAGPPSGGLLAKRERVRVTRGGRHG